ncbi:MAG: hypothetical protein HOP12_14840, partial [Candidatus Eisenbacteria bacterium]|nr:hypothetical protein [Candidatus Eisenbacteria bacterium]
MRFAFAWLALLLPITAFAQSGSNHARVIWTRLDRAVVAADSGVWVPGYTLAFTERGRALASGVLEQVIDDRLAIVRLTAGSLARVKKLERVRVIATEPEFEHVTLLRVGVPSGPRSNLAFSRSYPTLNARFAPPAYRAETLAVDVHRLVRATRREMSRFLPDTLLLRQFAEAGDQEIALERGEVDVAVFWPGEPSARIRTHPSWGVAGLGIRARGMIAATTAVPPALDSTLDAMNARMFGGDLLPWRELRGATAAGRRRTCARS